MSFDEDFVPAYFTNEVKKIESDDGNIGIFREGTDTRDLEDVDSDLEELNEVIKQFAVDQKLEYKPSNMYYHYRFENNNALLKMAETTMSDKRDVTDTDVYFFGHLITSNPSRNAQYVARLNHRLYTTSNDISVWTYEDGKFKRLKDLEGSKFNNDIYRSVFALYANSGAEKCDPFWEIAKTVHPFLKGKGFR